MRFPVEFVTWTVFVVAPSRTSFGIVCTHTGVAVGGGGGSGDDADGRLVARRTYWNASEALDCAVAVSCATVMFDPSHDRSFVFAASKQSTVGGVPLSLCAMTTVDVGVDGMEGHGPLQR